MEAFSMKRIIKLYYKVKPFLKIILYLLFILIYIGLIGNTHDPFTKVFFTAVLVLVVLFNILYDYLKYLYQQLQIAFTIELDLEKAQNFRDKICKHDLFKGFKDSILLSDLLISLDTNQPQLTLDLIDSNPKFFTSSMDMIYIRNHSIFKAYTLLENRTKSKQAYQELNKLRDVSQRKSNKQLSPLYNWDQIDALYFYISKNSKKSIEKFKNCNTSTMNPRELTHYYYEYYLALLSLEKNKEAELIMKSLKNLNPQSKFIE